jgi:nitrous oxidase accessory protein NosD
MVLTPSAMSEVEQSSIDLGGDILYVGGGGEGNYTRIQDAIDNASNGDTVFVYSGMYSDYFSENLACVKINKSLTLLGENRSTTIINGSSLQRVVFIYADGVQVKGFTIQNGGVPDPSIWGIGVDVQHHKKNAVIADNIIIHNQRGIYVEQFSSDVQIYDNIIRLNLYGIETDYQTNFTEIHYNLISDNEYGIYSWNSEISLHHNHITNNSIGVYLTAVKKNYIIADNEIRDNNIGISISHSKSTIERNNFINNNEQVSLTKAVLLITIPTIPFVRQRWKENYWDDWEEQSPRPLVGVLAVYITIFIPIKPFYIQVRIGRLPYIEFDWRPALKPYEIGV